MAGASRGLGRRLHILRVQRPCELTDQALWQGHVTGGKAGAPTTEGPADPARAWTPCRAGSVPRTPLSRRRGLRATHATHSRSQPIPPTGPGTTALLPGSLRLLECSWSHKLQDHHFPSPHHPSSRLCFSRLSLLQAVGPIVLFLARRPGAPAGREEFQAAGVQTPLLSKGQS